MSQWSPTKSLLPLVGAACCAAVVSLLVGCSSTDMKKGADAVWNNDVFSLKDEQEPKTPVRMVSLWSDSVLHHGTHEPTRGFGGRIFFYNEKHRPIEVDGELVVYAYDDTENDDENRPPERKYVFPAEKFGEHLSPGDLGTSYSVWLPWDAVGGEQREISLVPVLVTKDGKTVMGESTRSVLPGKKKEMPRRVQLANSAVPQTQPVQQVSYDQPQMPSAAPALRLKTTTIAVPNTLRERFERAQQQRALGEGPVSLQRKPSAQPTASEATGARPVMEAAPQGAVDLSRRPTAAAPVDPAAASRPVGQRDRFGRPRHRVLGAPIARPTRDRARWERYQSIAPLPDELPPSAALPSVIVESAPNAPLWSN